MKFKTDDDRAEVLFMAAAIAAHGMLAGGEKRSSPHIHIINDAFDFAEKFLTEAERRFPSITERT
jgi:hypothetical protein